MGFGVFLLFLRGEERAGEERAKGGVEMGMGRKGKGKGKGVWGWGYGEGGMGKGMGLDRRIGVTWVVRFRERDHGDGVQDLRIEFCVLQCLLVCSVSACVWLCAVSPPSTLNPQRVGWGRRQAGLHLHPKLHPKP